jgi:hypothetical protein
VSVVAFTINFFSVSTGIKTLGRVPVDILFCVYQGEVLRIRVPFSGEPSGELAESDIQRHAKEISPRYNGHKVTIQVSRSVSSVCRGVRYRFCVWCIPYSTKHRDVTFGYRNAML